MKQPFIHTVIAVSALAALLACACEPLQQDAEDRKSVLSAGGAGGGGGVGGGAGGGVGGGTGGGVGGGGGTSNPYHFAIDTTSQSTTLELGQCAEFPVHVVDNANTQVGSNVIADIGGDGWVAAAEASCGDRTSSPIDVQSGNGSLYVEALDAGVGRVSVSASGFGDAGLPITVVEGAPASITFATDSDSVTVPGCGKLSIIARNTYGRVVSRPGPEVFNIQTSVPVTLFDGPSCGVAHSGSFTLPQGSTPLDVSYSSRVRTSSIDFYTYPTNANLSGGSELVTVNPGPAVGFDFNPNNASLAVGECVAVNLRFVDVAGNPTANSPATTVKLSYPNSMVVSDSCVSGTTWATGSTQSIPAASTLDLAVTGKGATAAGGDKLVGSDGTGALSAASFALTVTVASPAGSFIYEKGSYSPVDPGDAGCTPTYVQWTGPTIGTTYTASFAPSPGMLYVDDCNLQRVIRNRSGTYGGQTTFALYPLRPLASGTLSADDGKGNTATASYTIGNLSSHPACAGLSEDCSSVACCALPNGAAMTCSLSRGSICCVPSGNDAPSCSDCCNPTNATDNGDNCTCK